MENSSGVEDLTRESRAVAMAKLNSLPRTKYAADIGCKFAELYYSMMRTSPEYANEFYDERGEFQTVFEDGSAIVVRTRLQVKHILMRPMSACRYLVKSIIPMSCGGSSGGVMVMVTGERFTQNLLLEHRPERMLGYAIVVSLTQYIPEGPVTYHQTPLTIFGGGDSQAITGAEKSVITLRRPEGPVTYNQTPLTTFGGGDSQAITGAEKSVNTSILKKPDYSISVFMDSDFGHAAEVTKDTVISTEITHIKQPDTAFEFESITEPTSANIATGNVIETATVKENTSITETAAENTATGSVIEHETASEKTVSENIEPKTANEITTFADPASLNNAQENIAHLIA
ncbi:Nuclear transport factor 2, eukaryote,NTF2-like domain [Cinara cedri]|uniref:Nuclear transport factor 2, eukaryote,NTF2-like domain n=1 Tax=Cinara cedri TaxID=506608 RepID=A0A5E4MM81_9HEMI|nr:Nuclear transport factor 2, eukaryote,NTF2-like domain [Cinara cedri]